MGKAMAIESPEDYLAGEILIRSLRLNRLTASERAALFEILKRMEDDLIDELQSRDLTEIGRRDRAALLRQAQDIISQYYGDISDHVAETLTGLGRAEADVMAKALQTAFGVSYTPSLPTEGYFKSLLSDTLIEGAPSAQWWQRQGGDMSFRFANAVRQGLAQAETNDQIIRRVRGTDGLMGIARRNVAAMVNTSVAQVSADARRATFAENDDIVKGIRQISTLDSHTSQICIAYSGAEWKNDKEHTPIPPNKLPYNGGVERHWNCRSVEVPITKTYAELGLDVPEKVAGTRASSLGQISAKTTMAEFIKMHDRGFADELLGVGKADLFLSGKITLQDLLDQSGRPLTLKELQELYD